MAGGTRRLGNRTRATQASPPHTSTTPAPTGMKGLPKDHDKKPPCEGGGRVVWSGDACVAHGGRDQATGDWDEGDASVLTPHNPTPAPTGMKGLPGRH